MLKRERGKTEYSWIINSESWTLPGHYVYQPVIKTFPRRHDEWMHVASLCGNVLCGVRGPAVLLSCVSTVPLGGGNRGVHLQSHLRGVHTVSQGDATPAGETAHKPPQVQIRWNPPLPNAKCTEMYDHRHASGFSSETLKTSSSAYGEYKSGLFLMSERVIVMSVPTGAVFPVLRRSGCDVCLHPRLRRLLLPDWDE